VIIALDIETIPNPDTLALLTEPEVKLGNLKDPAKIADKIAEVKAAQIADMGLDPMTGRVLCFAAANNETETGAILEAMTDDAERAVIQELMQMLGYEAMRLVTWNGGGFDLPFIYKRAMILGVNPADFQAPPLNAWTKRYTTDTHFDLMQVWGNWTERTKLDTVAAMVLGERKQEIDFTTFPELMQSEEGRNKIAEYCMQDTRLTWRLWERMRGVLFAD
jgi:hypothetical protein